MMHKLNALHTIYFCMNGKRSNHRQALELYYKLTKKDLLSPSTRTYYLSDPPNNPYICESLIR